MDFDIEVLTMCGATEIIGAFKKYLFEVKHPMCADAPTSNAYVRDGGVVQEDVR